MSILLSVDINLLSDRLEEECEPINETARANCKLQCLGFTSNEQLAGP